MSPEMLKDEPYSFKSDIWALGCLLYEMTTLTPSFDGNNTGAVINKVLNERYLPISDK
jgi:NIMA (never in mitosis gene a)-related kinase